MSFDVRDYFGARVPVHHCYGAYRLPDGLREGTEVILEDFQPGYWTVRYKGSRYLVAMPCVGSSGRLPPLSKEREARQIHPGCKPRVRRADPMSGQAVFGPTARSRPDPAE